MVGAGGRVRVALTALALTVAARDGEDLQRP